MLSRIHKEELAAFDDRSGNKYDAEWERKDNVDLIKVAIIYIVILCISILVY